jgi:hypothetical protein
MSRRTASRLAWSLWAVALVLVLPGPVVSALVNPLAGDIPYLLGFIAVQLGASTAGAIIASRFPGNAVGWLFLAIGLGVSAAFALAGYAELGLTTDIGPLPGADLAAWAEAFLFIPAAMVLPIVLLFVFPDGRLPSPRWRPVFWTVAAFGALGSCVTAFKTGRVGPEGGRIPNPLAAPGDLGPLLKDIDSVTNMLAPVAFACGVAAIVVRYRRSGGVERQQVKWFAYAAAVVAVGFALTIATPGGLIADLGFLAGLLGLAGLPVAAGIAIFRYRLYDIDVVINRTLVYGGLTATLVAAYLGSVLLLQLALSPLTEQSDLAIAGSTLAVAALFRPLRSRIQATVDRRFFRRRYDAARTLESFGARLRDEVELDSLDAELRWVVAQTMQPAHVSVWLRGEGGRS